MTRTARWSDDWLRRRRGQDCPFCAEGRPDENRYGVRVAAGVHSDAYLQRQAPLPGYTIVVWRGRHAVDLTELNDEEASGYWLEVVRVARALRQAFEPLHVNYTTLGNMLPHLHTNVVLRYLEDPAPEADLPLVGGAAVPDEDFRAQASAVRSRLRAQTRFESNAEGTP